MVPVGTLGRMRHFLKLVLHSTKRNLVPSFFVFFLGPTTRLQSNITSTLTAFPAGTLPLPWHNTYFKVVDLTTGTSTSKYFVPELRQKTKFSTMQYFTVLNLVRTSTCTHRHTYR